MTRPVAVPVTDLTHDQLITETRRNRALLHAARAALDRLAGCSDPHRPAAIIDAAEIAQSIVDEIGDPDTGQHARAAGYRGILIAIAALAADVHTIPERRLHGIRSMCLHILQWDA